MKPETLTAEISSFLESYFQVSITADDEDLTRKIPLDSLSLFEIIFFLEEKYKVKIPARLIRLNELNSVNKIASVVRRAH